MSESVHLFVFISSDLDDNYGIGRVEQERRVGRRPSTSPSAHLRSILPSIHYKRSLGVGADFEDAGILLRQHELHELVLQNHGPLLQA